MAYFKIRTTGTVPEVPIKGLNKVFKHPFPSANPQEFSDILAEFGVVKLSKSSELQAAIDSGQLAALVDLPKDVKSLNSEWVTATLGDISGLEDILDDIKSLQSDINAFVDGIVQVINGIITIVEIAKSIVSAVEDVQKAIIEAAIAAAELIKDALIAFLRKILDFGLYTLPHLETFEWQAVIRNAILSPGFESESEAPVDRYMKIPNAENPSDYHYERVRRSDRAKKTDYAQFIKDITESMDDLNDKLRPQFGPETKVSGLTVAVAADNIVLFIVIYLLLSLLWKGKEGTTAQMGILGKIVRLVIGESETLARTENQETKNEFLVMLEAIEETLKNAGEDILEIINRFLALFDISHDPDEADGAVSIEDATISGASAGYSWFQSNDPTNGPPNQFQVKNAHVFNSTTPAATSTINFVNSADIDITTNSKGALFAKYNFAGGNSQEFLVGEGKKRYTIKVPLEPVGNGIILTTGQIVEAENPTNPLNINTDGSGNWFNSSATMFSTPTSVEVVLAKLEKGHEGKELLGGSLFDNNLDNPNGSLQTNGKQGFTIYLPRMNRISEAGRELRDGYRHNIFYSMRLDQSTHRKIASYMGISESELPQAITFSSREFNATGFGPDFSRCDIEVQVTPQIDINSSFDGRLVVNGIDKKADEVKIGVRQANFIFKGIDIGDVPNVELQFYSKQNISINENGIETEFTVYSSPEIATVRKTGGKLGPVKITSGNRVNVTENIFDVAPPGENKGLDMGQFSVTGVTGGPGLDRIKNNAFRWNETFGDPGKKDPPGITSKEAQTVNALYRLTGIKARGTMAFAVIESGDKSRVEMLGQSYFGPNTSVSEDVPIIGGINLGGNRFSQNLILPWNGKETSYSIRVYQSGDPSFIGEIRALSGITDQKAKMLERIGDFPSKEAIVEVTVTNKASALQATPPNWITLSLGAFFPIVDPIDERLTEFIDILKDAIPAGPYDAIEDWLDLVKEKIQGIIEVIEKIRDIINNIFALLNIGGDGFYFLAIGDANGNAGFKERLNKVPVPDKLSSAKYVTGFQFLVPGSAGAALMDLFSKLPSAGQDNVKVPEDKALKEQLGDSFDSAKDDVKNRLKNIKDMGKKIKEVSRDEIGNASYRANDID